MTEKVINLKETVLVQQVKRRLEKQNKNWIGIITGETGSGKSLTAIALGELIDPDFSIEKVVLDPNDFLDLLSHGLKNEDGTYAQIERGSILIWDEAGTTLPARRWQSVQNQLLNYVLQTFRYRNVGVLFTLPTMRMLDIQARTLVHTYFHTEWIDYAKKLCFVKAFNFEYNDWQDKIYRHCLRGDDDGAKVNLWGIHLPSEAVIKQYEAKKDRHLRQLYQNIKKSFSSANERESGDEVKTKAQKITELYEAGERDKSAIMRKTGASLRYINDVFKEKKIMEGES